MGFRRLDRLQAKESEQPMSTTDETPILHLPRAQTAEPLSDGERYVKEIRKHKWVGALLAALLGVGGAVGGAVTATDRSEVNQVEVKNIKEANKALDIRVSGTESDIQDIKTSVFAIETSQAIMASGIGELKKENVDRLKEELEEAKREIRRHRLNNR